MLCLIVPLILQWVGITAWFGWDVLTDRDLHTQWCHVFLPPSLTSLFLPEKKRAVPALGAPGELSWAHNGGSTSWRANEMRCLLRTSCSGAPGDVGALEGRNAHLGSHLCVPSSSCCPCWSLLAGGAGPGDAANTCRH